MKYQISRDAELDIITLGKILNDFKTRFIPKYLNYKNYYDGNQKIMLKAYSDPTKPCNKVAVNYCYQTVLNYLGYLTGIPISYSNGDEALDDVLNYNDTRTEDNSLLKQALIYGRAFEMNYVDKDKKQRYKVLETSQCIPIYSDDLDDDLLYVIRFFKDDVFSEPTQERYTVEVYGIDKVRKYKSNPGFSSFTLIDEQKNIYNQVPITVFELNDEQESIFWQIITLQDAYNSLISDQIDDADQFADAYLTITGAIADGDDIQQMKENRVLLLDIGSTAQFLTKNSSESGTIQNEMQNINDHIHALTFSPDFNDERFMAQSGVALQYKLVGFENVASSIESHMKKALQKRIELIYSVLELLNGTNEEEYWRDCEIRFTRNLPNTLTPQNANELNAYRGLVSKLTLLALLPFVTNVEDEIDKVKDEQEAEMSMYNFGGMNDEDTETSEAELLVKEEVD